VKISPADPEIIWFQVNKSGTTQNWLSWQRALRNWKNWTGSRKFTQIPSIWWKNNENRSIRYWDSFAHSKKNKKMKLRKVKYIAWSESLPSGLKTRYLQNSWFGLACWCIFVFWILMAIWNSKTLKIPDDWRPPFWKPLNVKSPQRMTDFNEYFSN